MGMGMGLGIATLEWEGTEIKNVFPNTSTLNISGTREAKHF